MCFGNKTKNQGKETMTVERWAQKIGRINCLGIGIRQRLLTIHSLATGGLLNIQKIRELMLS